MLSIARTDTEKERGFMGRNDVADDEMILFLDIEPGDEFHMRTVGCDLTIAALDANLRVISALVVESETGEMAMPQRTCYVLEGNARLHSSLVVGEVPDCLDFMYDMPI